MRGFANNTDICGKLLGIEESEVLKILEKMVPLLSLSVNIHLATKITI